VDAALGRYRVISKIGAGGMATVDLAEDTRLGRLVALKRMGGTVNVTGLSRLRREALAGASLNHPNLVSVYDILTLEDGELIIVMEYVQGETLRERLTRQGRLAPSDALPLLAGAAAGLDAIHGAGIVHRDVKPSNILLGADGAVKVADLGVASVPDRTSITTSGSIIGSLSYMAPEQLEPGPVTPALDIYALSTVAFEVLSGVKARKAQNPVALAHSIATKPPPSLQDAWPEAPRAVAELLRRGMSRRPADRPASAGELIAGLEAGFGAETVTGSARRTPRIVAAGRTPAPAAVRRAPPPRRERAPAARPEPRRPAAAAHDPGPRRWTLAAAALGAVGLAVALILLLNHGSSPAPKTAASGAKHHSHTTRSHSASTAHTTPRSATHTATSSASGAAASGSTAGGSAAGGSAAGSTAATSSKSAASSSVTTGAGAAGPSGSSSAATPVAAVESFYQLAAARRYPEAWALADPAFRAQLRGYRSFEAGQANDRSITFNSAHVDSQTATSATVSVRTTSVQSDGTQHCSGTVDLVPGASSGWLLHQIDINCT
jgi:eukaryotic-like serine/threonine-protein kinase